MPSSSIKIALADFHPTSNATHCRMIRQLSAHFPIEFSDNPDYLFFSIFGTTHRDPQFDRCVKILVLWENVRPDFSVCDYSLSFDYLNDPRNLRLPFYSDMNFYLEQEPNKSLIKPDNYNPTHILSSKKKFCNFIYSNGWPIERIMFFEKLSEYKRVDSGGAVRNNLGFKVENKRDFISPYKFTIAFENSSHPGYVTEKLIDPMFADSIPIYWGSPRASEEFNPRSFVNCHGYTSQQSAIEQVIKMDQDDSLYLEYLNAPWLHGNKPSPCCLPDYIIPFFQMVFADKKPRTSRPAVTITIPGHDPGWKIIL